MSKILSKLLKTESGWDVKDVVSTLNDSQKGRLLDEVVPVCQLFTTTTVMPNNDMGLMARYQEIKFLVEDSLAPQPQPPEGEK